MAPNLLEILFGRKRVVRAEYWVALIQIDWHFLALDESSDFSEGFNPLRIITSLEISREFNLANVRKHSLLF